MRLGPGTLIAKTDIKSAYRIIPIHPESIPLLGFVWDGYYYFDRFLPFGLALACNYFEKFSTALVWIAQQRHNNTLMTHIIDDFMFFGAPATNACQRSLTSFITLAYDISLPLAAKKTHEPATKQILHGLLVDTDSMTIRIPSDKLLRAKEALDVLVRSISVTLARLQSYLGLLSFICQAVVPGRAFLRRLYYLTRHVKSKNSTIRITTAARFDILAWQSFLESHEGTSMLVNRRWEQSLTFHIYTDAAASQGYAAVLGHKWIVGTWPRTWANFHISVLELYPIVAALVTWSNILSNGCVIVHCDNTAVCAAINKTSSPHMKTMTLLPPCSCSYDPQHIVPCSSYPWGTK